MGFHSPLSDPAWDHTDLDKAFEHKWLNEQHSDQRQAEQLVADIKHARSNRIKGDYWSEDVNNDEAAAAVETARYLARIAETAADGHLVDVSESPDQV